MRRDMSRLYIGGIIIGKIITGLIEIFPVIIYFFPVIIFPFSGCARSVGYAVLSLP